MDALLNWLWQGMLPALVLSAFVRACGPRLAARLRCRLWLLALAAILIAPIFVPWVASVAVAESGGIDQPAPVALPFAAQTSLPIVIALWVVLSLIALLRFAVSLVRVNRARKACVPFPAERARNLRHWHAVGGSARARLALSDDVRSAAVLGAWSPVIAVNPTLVTALDDEELDQIVMHEWAHVSRRDYGLNAAEGVILAIAGLHPAVVWITRQLRLEREVACDDLVVSIVGSTRQYAACLLKLGMIASADRDRLAAPAALKTPQLTARIHRLLDVRRQRRALRLAGSLGAAIVVVTAVTVTNIELVGLADPLLAPVTAVIHGVAPNRKSAADVAKQGAAPSEPRREAPAARSYLSRNLGGRRAIAATPGQSSQAVHSRLDSHTGESVHQTALPQPSGQISSRAPGVTVEPLERLELGRHVMLSSVNTSEATPPQRFQTPWGAAAETGVAVGRGSQKAAAATAGFFTRVSKSVAGAFVPGNPNGPKK